MNTFSQNRNTTMYRQSIRWNRNLRPPGHFMPRKNNFNSPWPSQTLSGCEQYWCETCDKGFMTKTLLNYHIQRHQKCNIDGCQFVAHPKVITKHIQMQHATGLYKRIGKLDNPEDIKKWREERKRKYPTKENVEKRQAELKEKIKRGEKMGLKHGVNRFNNVKSGFDNKKQQHINHEKYNKTLKDKKITPQVPNKKRKVTKIVQKVMPAKEETRKLQPFRGIQDLVADDIVEEETPEVSNNLIVDEDVTVVEVIDETIAKPTVCGALTSLICNYESSEEEDMELNAKTVPIKTPNNLNTVTTDLKNKDNVNKDLNVIKETIELGTENKENKLVSKTDSNSIININECENESGPEETTVIKPPTNNELKPVKRILTRKERILKCEKAKSRFKPVNMRRKLPSTLLEKLLHKEIQHERNVILQCVRYVVENKYFDKA